jgi:hypothetical protein
MERIDGRRPLPVEAEAAVDVIVLGLTLGTVMGGMMLWWLLSGWLREQASPLLALPAILGRGPLRGERRPACT